MHLKELEASIFIAISPNLNFGNSSNEVRFKQHFQRRYQQVHVSAVSSDIGAQTSHIQQETLIGGAAILTFDQWASKIESTTCDPRGHGTYTITTIREKITENYLS